VIRRRVASGRRGAGGPIPPTGRRGVAHGLWRRSGHPAAQLSLLFSRYCGASLAERVNLVRKPLSLLKIIRLPF